MPIELNCPTCGKHLSIADSFGGKKGKCPFCRAILTVPRAEDILDEYWEEQDSFELEPEEKTEVSLTTLKQLPHEPLAPEHSSRPITYPSRLEEGHSYGFPSVNVAIPKRSSSLGIVSLILGLVAFLFCWIPILGLLSIPLSALGLLLGLIGLVVAISRRGSGIGWPIGGSVSSGFALAIALTQLAAIGGIVASVGQAAEELSRDLRSANEAPEGTPSSEPEANQWPSADSPIRQGDFELLIRKVHVGKVPLQDTIGDRMTTSKDNLLSIQLQLTNESRDKKAEYRTWRGERMFSRDYATLKDNFGNNYKRISFGFSTEIVGSIESDSVYPGKKINDVLVFEMPVPTVEYLKLELPASNFGGVGMLRLKIPRSMIQLPPAHTR